MPSSSLPARPGASYREIDADRAGQRIDNYLISILKGVPRSHVYRLVRSGQVRVNSRRVSPTYRICAGDRVRIPPVAQAASAVSLPPAESLDWLAARILYEDRRILALDKPAGLASHGGSGIRLGCIEALRQLRDEPGLELAHRLDRETSGVLLVARRRSALRRLHALLREHGMRKEYLALVEGDWPADIRAVHAALSRSEGGTQADVRIDPEGKRAVSQFRPVRRFGGLATLVAVRIETGRTHQIRVHAAHAGYPIAGDQRYGSGEIPPPLQAAGLNRMFLHASALSFSWPDTHEPFGLCAPLPSDLAGVLSGLAAVSD